jgi:putative membrane-bound dehydrogenase-like protein
MLGRLTALLLTVVLTFVGWLSLRWWPESESEARAANPAADSPAPAKPPAGFHQVKLNGHTFTLPDGFAIELAAGPPQAERPIVAAFDDKGRLYVCDSSGSNAKVTEQVKTKPHRIVRLESTRGDGKYNKSTVFVPNVMFPEGAMWLNGSLYVAAPPQILKFTDTDGDGKADKEEVWFDGQTLTGCANDLHGPYLGPDGWVYWCKGAFAKQEYTLPSGKKFGTRAAHIFRARPDGTGIEPVMTGGMDNPVDVVFTPGGERIFSTTFFQRPGDGKRDGLIHAVYGGIYGKDHDPVYEHPWTSPQFMPVLTHMGPAAPCGLHRYESDQFGKEYENNVFCCQFNLRKVSRHVLVPSGSTFITKDSDFVVSDNLDFHPTDVIEDADGSLLILDTGGWYKLCCPTSQLVKPDVTGAIYRVKRVGAHKVEDPRGEKIDWAKAKPEELAKLLGDPRPVVRWKAVAGLAVDGPENPARIWLTIREGPEVAKLHAIWAAARLPSSTLAVALIEEVTRPGQSDDVRAAAAHVLGLYRKPPLSGFVSGIMKGWFKTERSPAARRAIAEAFGRLGDKGAVEVILPALADEANDRALDHSLTYALIELADPKETAEGLMHKSPRVRRAVLAALNAMPNGNLDPKPVLAELDATDAALRETAWWVAGKHPDWGDHLVGHFRQALKWRKAPAAEVEELAARLAKFASNPAVGKLLAEAIRGDLLADAPPFAMDGMVWSPLVAARAMARAGLKSVPAEWYDALAVAVASRRAGDFAEVLRTTRALPPPKERPNKLVAALCGVADDQRLPSDVRLSAVAGVVAVTPQTLIGSRYFALAVASLGENQPAPVRSLGLDVLARARLDEGDLSALAKEFPKLGPSDLTKLLPAFEKSKDEDLGLKLVAALTSPKVRPGVRAEIVKPILDKYPKPVRDEAEKLYALLAEARKDETAKLERLLKDLPAGDIRRGQIVFNGSKGQCAACHKIGYVGGLVGPDLTKIGGIRSERDLLESIVFPSASFVRSYEPVRVATTDGRTLNGVLKKDAPDEIVLAVAADKEERVARADVESIAPSSVSVMPAGLDQQLTVQELADLVAFLKACK